MRSRPGSLVALLCVASLALAGCPGSRRAPAPPPDIDRAWEVLDDYCEAHGDDQVLCQRAGFLDARDAVIDLWGAARRWQVEAGRVGGHAGVDAAVHAGEVAELQEEVESERRWKWIMLGIGVAAGALAVGVPVGIAR